MIQSAVKQNITHFGLSGHAPIHKENEWSMNDLTAAENYISDIEKCRLAFPETRIYQGIEADYIPNLSYSFNELREKLRLQYIIGSVHLVTNENGIWFIDGPAEGYDRGLEKHYNLDFNKAMSQYYQQLMTMLEVEQFEILAHCDKVMMNNRGRFMSNEDPQHLKLLKDTLKLAREKEVWVEINTRGLYKGLHDDFYPGKYIFPFIKEEKIKIIYSADGHATDQITKGYSELDKAIEEYGLKDLVVRPEDIEERMG